MSADVICRRSWCGEVKKSRAWLEGEEFGSEVLRGQGRSGNPWNNAAKDSKHYTDWEKTLFVDIEQFYPSNYAIIILELLTNLAETAKIVLYEPVSPAYVHTQLKT